MGSMFRRFLTLLRDFRRGSEKGGETRESGGPVMSSSRLPVDLEGRPFSYVVREIYRLYLRFRETVVRESVV